MIRIGIIEDLDEYRNLLKLLLNHAEDMEVVFSVESGEEAIDNWENFSTPDLCIIDINLPGQSGIEIVNWINTNHPGILCLICTVYDSDEKIFQSLEAGAHGYILKATPPAAIVEAVKELYKGGSPMSSEVARKVVTAFSRRRTPESDILSEREREILELLSKGLFYKEISNQLTISIQTVKKHCFNIYKKLHVNNRTGAINKYRNQ